MTHGKVALRTVLVVENDRLLKLFMSNLVVADGFVAVDASNANEAIAILETRSDIALLITSVMMRSGMDGVELAHQVNTRWPSIRIIVVSGQPGLSESDLPARALFLAKPYHDDEMAFEIRALMNP
jgi:two-component system, response regulator PdtaR